MGRLLRTILVGSGLLGGTTAAAYRHDLKQLHFDVASGAGPLLRLLDPEAAHNLGLWAAAAGLFPRETRPDPPRLATSAWGRQLSNPFGLAAGFDKNAEAMDGLLGLGLGFMEIGSVTPLPQPGNPKPRAFRLPELRAVINRYGFNSDGIDAVSQRLAAYQAARQDAGSPPRRLLAVNLGKNKESEDAAADYALGVAKLGRHADFLVINVSSPNTQGLRALQGRRQLEQLVAAVKAQRDRMHWPAGPPPLLVKIAPDLTPDEMKDIAALTLRLGVDGLVVGNTTISRPGAVAQHQHGSETGGLSGKPLLGLATDVLRQMYQLTEGRVPIIGCGGVSSGEDAYQKIRAGASLVELYTSLVYEGPALIPRLKQELDACLLRDGFASVADAVGADHKPSARTS